ncbi:MAG: hypothetical protein K1X92_09510 [Bacteroidia bacterium]|nr:hypothetical protein [Bacteroidia bacterium]
MSTKLSFGKVITAGAIAAGVSAVVNAVLFFIFHAAGVITDDIFVQPNQPMTIVPVVMSSIIPTLIGACVFFLFDKFTANGFKIFSIVAAVLLILSFGNPFFLIPGVTVAYGIALNVMHVVVAASLLYFINRSIKQAV